MMQSFQIYKLYFGFFSVKWEWKRIFSKKRVDFTKFYYQKSRINYRLYTLEWHTQQFWFCGIVLVEHYHKKEIDRKALCKEQHQEPTYLMIFQNMADLEKKEQD